jgi:hypothetical protein
VGRPAGGVRLEELRHLAGLGVPDDHRHDGAARDALAVGGEGEGVHAGQHGEVGQSLALS